MIQLAGDNINFNLIQVYAPTASRSDQEVESFYYQLKQLGAYTKNKMLTLLWTTLIQKL
ncbi:unnamed protein product, partial [Rotaria socialis]